MYALASLRIGYFCGTAEVFDMVRRTHIVYSVNTLAQQSAVAAIKNKDGSFIQPTRVIVRDAREMLSAMFEKYGLEYICNKGNYLMVFATVDMIDMNLSCGNIND